MNSKISISSCRRPLRNSIELIFGVRLKNVKFWRIKPEVRILGVDDGSFEPRSKVAVPLVGVVFRGGQWLEGVIRTYIERDGTDVTERLVDMVNKTRHKGQLRVIMVDGLTFAGFNVLDAREVFRETGLPVIAISRQLPDMGAIRRAIEHLPGWKKRWKIIKGTGKIYPVVTKSRGAPIYMQAVGINKPDAENIVKVASTRSLVPEPLRVAHLVATAMVRGESYGRA